MEQEKSNVRAIILAIIVTAIIVGGGVYFWQKSTLDRTDVMPLPEKIGQERGITAQIPTQGRYENSTYGFSLVFPINWGTVREREWKMALLVQRYTK